MDAYCYWVTLAKLTHKPCTSWTGSRAVITWWLLAGGAERNRRGNWALVDVFFRIYENESLSSKVESKEGDQEMREGCVSWYGGAGILFSGSFIFRSPTLALLTRQQEKQEFCVHVCACVLIFFFCASYMHIFLHACVSVNTVKV